MLLLAMVGCSAPGNSSPARAPVPEAPQLIAGDPLPQRGPVQNQFGLACGPDGKLGDETSLIEFQNRVRRHGARDVRGAPDLRSALISASPSAVLLSCRGGAGLRAIAFHRDDFHGPDVDRSQIFQGLNQIGWYQFSPDGKKLVFAITAHSRRPNPEAPPQFQVTTLVSKFVAVDVDTFRYIEIDTRKQGFNRLLVSDSHIVFWGKDASYRADFAGHIVRLTTPGAQSERGPMISPDGRWMAESLRDKSYLLTSVFEPNEKYVLWPPEPPIRPWAFNVFSADSSLLAYATYRADPEQSRSRDYQFRIHDMATHKRRSVLSILGSYTCLMKVSPDNRELLVYSQWILPRRTTRLYCVNLDSGRISVAPQRTSSGNLYVDDAWTTAEIGRQQGQSAKIPIECATWPAVASKIISPPGGAVMQIPRSP